MSSRPVFLVVTPNPAIDRRIHAAQLEVSEVNRATRVENSAGGKGLNVVRAARTLGREGAIVIAPEGCWQAKSPTVMVASTVGGGDALLAGFAVSLLNGGSVEDALKLDVACGAANAMSHLPGRFEYETVKELLAQVETKEFI